MSKNNLSSLFPKSTLPIGTVINSSGRPAHTDPAPPPLTDADVEIILKRLSKLSSKDVNKIFDDYVNLIKTLISTVRKTLDFDDEDQIVELDRMIRIINLAPNDEIFIRSKDKIWFARSHIENKNEDWFINRDYSAHIKKDQKQVMIETLISIIQTGFSEMSPREKEVYWGKAQQMLDIVKRYKMLTGEP